MTVSMAVCDKSKTNHNLHETMADDNEKKERAVIYIDNIGKGFN
jgi:hypothetical protein